MSQTVSSLYGPNQIDGLAGIFRGITYSTAGVPRFTHGATADAETAPVVLTTSAASTSSILLSFASTTGVVAGQTVGGTGIAAGSTVISFVANTSVTLSAAATVAAGASVSFYANAGSLFSLRAYDDGGNLIYTPLTFGRASGSAVTFSAFGYGPIVVQGGSAILGNARGLGAFDGQQYRAAATQVASGAGAALFGNNNTASGPCSFVSGQGNSITGFCSFSGGLQSSDRGRYASFAWGSGVSAAPADTQTSFGVLRANSTTSAAVRMTADGNAAGSANIWNIPNNTAYLLRLEILGWSAAGILTVSYLARFRLKRGATAASTVLSNTTLTADTDNDSITGLSAPTLAADTSNGGLLLTSGYATSATMRWAARVISVVELQ